MEKNFDTVMHEPILRNGWRKYLRSTYSSENLLFWQQVKFYKSEEDSQKRKIKAEKIKKEFLEVGATNEINIADDVRKQIIENINSSPDPPIDIFDDVHSEIFYLMRDECINFLCSPIYNEHVEMLQRMRRMTKDEEEREENRQVSEADWELLFEDVKPMKLPPNSIIIEQSKPSSYLFQLLHGSLLIQKLSSGQKINIGKIENEGCIFGEMSIFGTMGLPTRSILSYSTVVIRRVNIMQIFAKFQENPNLALRFYRHLGRELSHHLLSILFVAPSSEGTLQSSLSTSSASSPTSSPTSSPKRNSNDETNELRATFQRAKSIHITSIPPLPPFPYPPPSYPPPPPPSSNECNNNDNNNDGNNTVNVSDDGGSNDNNNNKEANNNTNNNNIDLNNNNDNDHNTNCQNQNMITEIKNNTNHDSSPSSPLSFQLDYNNNLNVDDDNSNSNINKINENKSCNTIGFQKSPPMISPQTSPRSTSNMPKKAHFSVGTFLQHIKSFDCNGENNRPQWTGVIPSSQPRIILNIDHRAAKKTSLSVDGSALQLLFDLPENEYTIKEVACDLKSRIMDKSGTMYVTKTYLCFHAQIFGQKTTLKLPISNILDVHSSFDKFQHLIIVTSQGSYTFKMRSGEEIETLKQTIMILGTVNQNMISKRHTLNKSTSQGMLMHNIKRTIIPQINEIPELQQEDWELILEIFNSKDNILTFMKGDIIIQQGYYYNVIFQIISGSCRVEKSATTTTTISTSTMNERNQATFEHLSEVKISQGDIIGEIAMLTGCPADLSVIADDDFVDMYYIDGKYVHDILFQTHPHIVVKFYNYLCLNLVKLITRKEEELWKR